MVYLQLSAGNQRHLENLRKVWVSTCLRTQGIPSNMWTFLVHLDVFIFIFYDEVIINMYHIVVFLFYLFSPSLKFDVKVFVAVFEIGCFTS